MSTSREIPEIVVDLREGTDGEGVRGPMGERVANIRVIGPKGTEDVMITVALGRDRTNTTTWIRFTQVKRAADQIRKMTLRFWDRSA